MTRTTHPTVLLTVSSALLLVAARCSADGDAARLLSPEYPRLAKAVSELVVSIETFREAFPAEESSTAEVIRELQAAALDVRAIQSEDPQIRYIASESERAVAEAIAVFERIEVMPKPLAVEGFVGSFLCSYLGDPIVGPTM